MAEMAVRPARRVRLAVAGVLMWGVVAAAPVGDVEATPVTVQPAIDAPAASARAADARATSQATRKVRRPGKPRAVTATAGHERLTVRWKKPTSDGGARIRGYRVQLRQPDGSWTTVATTKAKARSRVITGLTNGTTSTVRVAARNTKGYGRSSVARAVLPTSLDVSIGGSHGCAVVPDGSVRCWGLNGSGQLGDGSTDDRCRRCRCPASTAPSPSGWVSGTAAPSSVTARCGAGDRTAPASWASRARARPACRPGGGCDRSRRRGGR